MNNLLARMIHSGFFMLSKAYSMDLISPRQSRLNSSLNCSKNFIISISKGKGSSRSRSSNPNPNPNTKNREGLNFIKELNSFRMNKVCLLLNIWSWIKISSRNFRKRWKIWIICRILMILFMTDLLTHHCHYSIILVINLNISNYSQPFFPNL